jgi:hypothetical protein
VSVTAADVTGNTTGILADNNGTGSTSITATGTVLADDVGIRAENTSTATGAMEIVTTGTGGVSGLEDGIWADNRGSGALNITVGNTVVGVDGVGIRTFTNGAGAANITLNSGAAVNSVSGLAISNDSGDSTTTVNTGASVAGDISLGDGSDNLTFAGGSFDTDAEFNGGDDIDATDGSVDVLTFVGSSGSLGGGISTTGNRSISVQGQP